VNWRKASLVIGDEKEEWILSKNQKIEASLILESIYIFMDGLTFSSRVVGLSFGKSQSKRC